MATDRIDDLPSDDDTRPPAGSHAHPESVPVGDWLVPEDPLEVVPDAPNTGDESIDFSTLPQPPEADAGSSSIVGLMSMDIDPDSGAPSSVVGMIPLHPGTDPALAPPADLSSIPDLPTDSIDVLADLPPVAPTEPASGWLDSGVNIDQSTPATPAPTVGPAPGDPTSDILGGPTAGESDVLRSLAEVPASDSNLLKSHDGSSRFEDPRDDTDDGTGPPSSSLRSRPDLFADPEAAERAAWDALSDDAPPGDSSVPLDPSADAAPPVTVPESDSAGRLDFNQLDPNASGSALFADSGISEMFGESGVNLLNPDGAAASSSGPGSSIFDATTAGNAAAPTHRPPTPPPDDEDVEMFNTVSPVGPTSASSILSGDARSYTIDDHDMIAPEAADDVAINANDDDAEVPWEDPDAATPTDIPVSQDDAIDILAEPDAEISWTAEPDDDHGVGLAGGTADIDHLTAVAPVAAPTPPTPTRKPLPSSPLESAKARPVAATRGSGGWFGGSAIGLAVGVGACAAAYFGGFLPSGTPVSNTPVPTVQPERLATTSVGQPPPTATVPTLADSLALLAAGDPAAALPGLEAAGEAITPVGKAARGQARWQTRVRELATAGNPITAGDPQLKQAAADLQAVMDADLDSDADRAAGARAALHLGLVKELSGDTAGAALVYSTAATKFPASRLVFTTSLNRLRVTAPPSKAARLTPRQAEDLSRAAVVALTLLQAERRPTPTEVEPGFLFWEAVNHATAGNYTEAKAAILKARTLHDRRRLALVGRGLNPLSDPLEQMFLQTCTDLAEYWTLRGEVYGHPTFGPLARRDGVAQSLGALVAVQKTAADLSARVAVVAKDAADAKAAVAVLEKEKKAVVDDLATAQKKLSDAAAATDAAQQALTERTKDVKAAQARADDAAKKLATAEGTLASVVKELKAAKLVGDKDDAATVLAKLPTILKDAATAANSADAQKSAAALAAVRKDLDAARDEAVKAKAALTAATAAAAKAKTDAAAAVAAAKAETEKATTTAQAEAMKTVTAAKTETKNALAKLDAEVKKAIAATQAAAQQKLDTLTAAVATARAEATAQKTAADARAAQAQADFTARLAVKDEQHRRDLAAARSGVEVPLTTAEVAAHEQAGREYAAGVALFFQARYSEAEARLLAATKIDAGDARYWYFLGLARRMQGRNDPTSFQTGAQWESQNLPSHRVVNAALERVQGAARQALDTYRP